MGLNNMRFHVAGVCGCISQGLIAGARIRTSSAFPDTVLWGMGKAWPRAEPNDNDKCVFIDIQEHKDV